MRNILFLSILAVGLLANLPDASAQLQTNESTNVASSERSSTIVTIEGVSYYVHNVAHGETFYGLTKLYGTDEQTIRLNNPLLSDGLKAGQAIKIPNTTEPTKPLSNRKMKRLFDQHIVNQGETAYSISKRYNISLAVLLEDNEGLDPAKIPTGKVLNIRKTSQGEAATNQIEEEIKSYSEALSDVTPGFSHIIVQRGDTLYSLSRELGLSVEELIKYNPLAEKGLNEGAIIRFPSKDTAIGSTPNGGQNKEVDLEPEQVGHIEINAFPNGVKSIDPSKPIKIVVMLPLSAEGVRTAAENNFMHFYQGILMGLNDLKDIGVSAKVDLFNTARSATEVREMLRNSPEFAEADVFIGPVYQESLDEVASFAAQRGIVVVSPLTAMEGESSANMFQVSPSASTKMKKLSEEFSSDKNVIVLASSNDDKAFTDEITPLLPSSAQRVSYSPALDMDNIRRLLKTDRENVIVVLSANAGTSDVLVRLSSMYNNAIARLGSGLSVKVVGSSSWSRIIGEHDLFFKLNVRYIRSYHSDRANARIADFDRRYLKSFGMLTVEDYPYRGYDIAKLFIGNIKLHGSDFMKFINDNQIQLLETPYHFQQIEPRSKFENTEWVKVCYGRDYSITAQ